MYRVEEVMGLRYSSRVSDGRAHDLHGLAAGVGVLVVSAAAFVCKVAPVDVWALPVGVLFGAWFLSPDLDMWRTSPISRWGPFKYLWAPYCWAFKHRGLSHSWIIGPCSRILYLGLPIVAAWWYWWEFAGLDEWLAYLAAGIVVGNWVHLLGDGIIPFRR